MTKKDKQIIFASIIITIFTLIIILLPWQENIAIKILRILLGSVYILFLPGYRTTSSFFGRKEIDRLERFSLSFALSISLVPLITFYINLLGVKITQISVRSVVAFVIVANITYIYTLKKTKIH